MERERFDAMTRLWATSSSRRRALAALVGAALAGPAAVGEARKKARRRSPRLTAQADGCQSLGHGQNVSGCDYSGEDHAGADLASSRMVGTIFRNGTLIGTNFSSSNLKNANFRDANLCGADLRSATLGGADFRGANLTSANLKSSGGCNSATFNADTTFCGTTMCDGSVRSDDCPGADPGAMCCSAAECAGSQLCVQGTCQPCTVCPSGCPFGTMAAAVAGTPAGGTIRICPGVYSTMDLAIGKNLTLVGAGPGDDPTRNTILESNRFSEVLVIVSGTVDVRDLRVTKGHSDLNGGGIQNGGALTLRNVTVIDNTADDNGGGVENRGTLTLAAGTLLTQNRASFQGGGIYQESGSTIMQAGSRVTGNQTGTGHLLEKGGGIYVESGTVTVADTTIVTGNTPDNCRPTGAVANCID